MIRQAHDDCATCDEFAARLPSALTDEHYSVTIVETVDDGSSSEPAHGAVIEREGPWLEQTTSSPAMFTRKDHR